MSSWTSEELDKIGRAEELQIAPCGTTAREESHAPPRPL
jgi:hypothetical protein